MLSQTRDDPQPQVVVRQPLGQRAQLLQHPGVGAEVAGEAGEFGLTGQQVRGQEGRLQVLKSALGFRQNLAGLGELPVGEVEFQQEFQGAHARAGVGFQRQDPQRLGQQRLGPFVVADVAVHLRQRDGDLGAEFVAAQGQVTVPGTFHPLQAFVCLPRLKLGDPPPAQAAQV
jgi:hypothetical protein